MKPVPMTAAPADADARKAIKPVVCYPVETLPRPDLSAYRALRDDLTLVETVVVPPREAATWTVPAGHFCRLVCSEGPQVGDLNLFNAHNLLSHGGQYHHCCHSNLTRAFAAKTGMAPREAEAYVHDVLNVFMCTGFTRDTGQYFMKASPVRPGDYLEFFAEIDLLGCMSACPGGDCSAEHSSDTAACHPMVVEIYKAKGLPAGWAPPPVNGYDGTHGL